MKIKIDLPKMACPLCGRLHTIYPKKYEYRCICEGYPVLQLLKYPDEKRFVVISTEDSYHE